MNFPDGLFGFGWLVAAWIALAAVLFWCWRTAPWRRLGDPRLLNVWLATIVMLTLIWSFNATVGPGMRMHLVGGTLFMLMFGRQLAIAGLSVVLAAVTLNGGPGTGWESYALNALMTIVVPVFVAWLILRFVERYLPTHFFVYVFVAAFFGAALDIVVTGLAAMLLLVAANVALPFGDLFISYVLLAFAEAWLTGAVITLMVVYYPDWVVTFDDRRYLWNK